MKASKFSDAQKAFIQKQGDDGMPVTEVCRKRKCLGFRTPIGHLEVPPFPGAFLIHSAGDLPGGDGCGDRRVSGTSMSATSG